ncbi:aminotransferase class V-fold PLP-dependent enzyme [Nafulsella turpanensis]|uniref:aminotransferase class V-fold PLP-dependent enzyme n=1 Tax=Nafulsella turpanensis TaxID=1265690 RepID=UPI00034A4DD5|nr:aminotransferase class V-fold PLP-dependent enzyme [Nafulsella turpanensis]
MISFYPGPSKVWDKLPQYLQEAFQEGVLSINHRSPEFVAISREAIRLLHEKLNIPKDYTIFFTSSATECWEIIAQSILGSSKSLHLYNGAFGEKWQEYTQKLTGQATARTFSPEMPPQPVGLELEENTLLLALTQNETSNGTALPQHFFQEVRRLYPEVLIAVDATSGMAGVNLDFPTADIWYASVQKCFGLPAGLALMICSPRALARAEALNERLHYNSLLFMQEKIVDAQTTYTPNVLGIYLLMRSLQDRPSITTTAALLKERYRQWVLFFEEHPFFRLLIKNSAVRSQTVLTLEGKEEEVALLKQAAKTAGLYLGNGYGKWKKNTFRIANFPALNETEIRQLKNFLAGYSQGS